MSPQKFHMKKNESPAKTKNVRKMPLNQDWNNLPVNVNFIETLNKISGVPISSRQTPKNKTPLKKRPARL